MNGQAAVTAGFANDVEHVLSRDVQLVNFRSLPAGLRENESY
jgi:hypothetical protein